MPDQGQTIPFAELSAADLVVDALYEGGTSGTIRDDPLNGLLDKVGNQGGFRPSGSPLQQNVKLVALFTTGAEPDWPDSLDVQTGLFTYFGDNRKPGQELHDTSRKGNLLLRDVFGWSHGTVEDRKRVPPFFLFMRTGVGRTVAFRGLLVPGGAGLTSDDELQAIWRSTKGQRFQNYRARFSVLDVLRVERAWIKDVMAGDPLSPNCPPAWRDWVATRTYRPLLAPATTTIRTKQQQLPEPSDAAGGQMIAAIHQHFAGRPHDFEACAVEIWRMMSPATGSCDLTRRSRDGGRDAVGEYLLGPSKDRLAVSFALEAKCYQLTNSVGVREVARLISRIRHRQFGVFVTSSFFHHQVYGEVREDGHPIALICARDIVEVLRANGLNTPADVTAWLERQFPALGSIGA